MTGAERYLASRLDDPEYRVAYVLKRLRDSIDGRSDLPGLAADLIEAQDAELARLRAIPDEVKAVGVGIAGPYGWENACLEIAHRMTEVVR